MVYGYDNNVELGFKLRHLLDDPKAAAELNAIAIKYAKPADPVYPIMDLDEKDTNMDTEDIIVRIAELVNDVDQPIDRINTKIAKIAADHFTAVLRYIYNAVKEGEKRELQAFFDILARDKKDVVILKIMRAFAWADTRVVTGELICTVLFPYVRENKRIESQLTSLMMLYGTIIASSRFDIPHDELNGLKSAIADILCAIHPCDFKNIFCTPHGITDILKTGKRYIDFKRVENGNGIHDYVVVKLECADAVKVKGEAAYTFGELFRAMIPKCGFICEEIVAHALAVYYRASCPPMHLNVFFNHCHPIINKYSELSFPNTVTATMNTNSLFGSGMTDNLRAMCTNNGGSSFYYDKIKALEDSDMGICDWMQYCNDFHTLQYMVFRKMIPGESFNKENFMALIDSINKTTNEDLKKFVAKYRDMKDMCAAYINDNSCCLTNFTVDSVKLGPYRAMEKIITDANGCDS